VNEAATLFDAPGRPPPRKTWATSIRLGELTRGEMTHVLGWINAHSPAAVRRALADLDALTAEDRKPVDAIDSLTDLA
jgi:hypothetical protein